MQADIIPSEVKRLQSETPRPVNCAQLQRGQLVRSVQGRDQNRLYFVVDKNDGIVFVADGIRRGMRRPKRKNPRHLEAWSIVEERVVQLLGGKHDRCDALMRELIQQFTRTLEKYDGEEVDDIG